MHVHTTKARINNGKQVVYTRIFDKNDLKSERSYDGMHIFGANIPHPDNDCKNLFFTCARNRLQGECIVLYLPIFEVGTQCMAMQER